MIELRALVRHARQLQVASIFDLLDHTVCSESVSCLRPGPGRRRSRVPVRC
jgi:hypothetical protein